MLKNIGRSVTPLHLIDFPVASTSRLYLLVHVQFTSACSFSMAAPTYQRLEELSKKIGSVHVHVHCVY